MTFDLRRPTPELRRRLAVFAVCVVLAVIHTWPLALHPTTLSRNDNGDAELNEWILAWVAHQLPRDPWHLFEGNIFYPAHDTLAYSEPLIVPGVLAMPLWWMGGSAVLLFNVMLIAGFALTAFAGYLLVEDWTGDARAGVAAGSVLAFNTHTLTRLSHVQAAHLYGLPLALRSTDRLIAGGRPRDALALALWMTVMAYTSGYLVVFATVMIAVALAGRAPEWWRRAGVVVPRFAVAAICAAVAIIPVYLPYRRVALEQHMVRPLDSVKEYSATLTGYIASAGRLHIAAWSWRFFKDPIDSFFPGVVVVLLAAVAAWTAFRRGDRQLRGRVVMLIAIAVTGVVLSLGTATPIYGWLYHGFPPMQGLRAAARFGNLFLLAAAALAGVGLALWRPRAAVAVAAIVLINIEALRAPFVYRPFTGIPGIYKLLAAEPDPVVLVEQPFFPRWAVAANAPYVLASTAHWRPLMNGYSGYTPESYQRYAGAFWFFPEDFAIQAMKDAGVTHVMVHPQRFERDAQMVLDKIGARSDLELVAVGPNGMRLYRLTR